MGLVPVAVASRLAAAFEHLCCDGVRDGLARSYPSPARVQEAADPGRMIGDSHSLVRQWVTPHRRYRGLAMKKSAKSKGAKNNSILLADRDNSARGAKAELWLHKRLCLPQSGGFSLVQSDVTEWGWSGRLAQLKKGRVRRCCYQGNGCKSDRRLGLSTTEANRPDRWLVGPFCRNRAGPGRGEMARSPWPSLAMMAPHNWKIYDVAFLVLCRPQFVNSNCVPIGFSEPIDFSEIRGNVHQK
jgi:hypothetical protein